MKKRTLLYLLVPVLAIAVTAVAWPEREGPKGLSDAPEAVRRAVLQLTTADAITDFEKEVDDGVTVYEVEFNGESAIVAESGAVIERERPLAVDQVPPAVLSAVTRKHPTGKIAKAETVTLDYYELTVVVDGKKRSVAVLASGEIDADEDADDDDDEEDDDDDEDDDNDNDEEDDD